MCTSILPGKAVPEMTYTVSGGTLNPTHSLTHSSISAYAQAHDDLLVRLVCKARKILFARALQSVVMLYDQ